MTDLIQLNDVEIAAVAGGEISTRALASTPNRATVAP